MFLNVARVNEHHIYLGLSIANNNNKPETLDVSVLGLAKIHYLKYWVGWYYDL